MSLKCIKKYFYKFLIEKKNTCPVIYMKHLISIQKYVSKNIKFYKSDMKENISMHPDHDLDHDKPNFQVHLNSNSLNL